jgi:hypothetical protein
MFCTQKPNKDELGMIWKEVHDEMQNVKWRGSMWMKGLWTVFAWSAPSTPSKHCVQMHDFNKMAASTPDTDVWIVRIKMCRFFVGIFG